MSTAEMEGVIAVARSTWTWDVLRRAESCNPSITPLCPPGAARWMDAGMYARWVLADLPAASPLWRHAQALITPVARRRLRDWLQRDGMVLDDGARPPGGAGLRGRLAP